jgi:hypothetical protein
MPLIDFQRLRGISKVLSATLGGGVLITMGALTVASPSSAVGTSSDSWKAADPAEDVTLVQETRVAPSFRPQFLADPCWRADLHARVHGLC